MEYVIEFLPEFFRIVLDVVDSFGIKTTLCCRYYVVTIVYLLPKMGSGKSTFGFTPQSFSSSFFASSKVDVRTEPFWCRMVYGFCNKRCVFVKKSG